MNSRNLKPFTVKNARQNGAKGGRASGEAKRQRKRLREYITEILELKADELSESENTDKTNAAAIAVKTVTLAKQGDIKALRLVYEVLGELDRAKVNIEINQKEIQDAYEAGQKDGIDSVIECLDNKSLEKLAGLTETEYNVTQ